MKIDVTPIDAAGPAALAAHLEAAGAAPAFATLHTGCTRDPAPLIEWARARGIALMGGTSCRGALTAAGRATGALFTIDDPGGDYGCALRPFTGPGAAAAEQAGREAVAAAMAAADRPGERPDLVWVYGTPGQEERVLAGIESVVGAETPILGGSAADDDVSGQWWIVAGGEVAREGVAVGVLYPSTRLSVAYQSGYAPTECAGTVTRAEGRRIAEIDGRPAAEVYAEWTGGAVDVSPLREAAVAGGGASGLAPRNILSPSAFWPLGREVTEVAGVPYHLLAHPAEADPEGGLTLFADVAAGERLVQMTGSADGLTARAGRVARLAAEAGNIAADDVAGALLVYCGGCMLSVEDRLDDVTEGMRTALPGTPFAGVFTFGEQGPILGAGNRHGNLMISCVVLSRK
ncbi:hypothetical protein DLJ49_08400 [Rhodovulum sp. 12E13]|uniref:FIST signal transduction protein n=1 Tax=Rhodovulum sp. 12E13 TaxID=2203891 RepID=UPI000E1635D7|nr:FIST N-terminal domain-containing protein [Rhodovulum sp. 12E13]RDC73121.1 hypothetical protein DLJ49_08400 [Rhodovulum sp. 12E13]